MRTNIDYGIYFNNDFCQIARMENGMPVIKRSEMIKDSMPLFVHFNKRGDILIGDTAFIVLKNDQTRGLKFFERGKSNTFIQFAKTLGTIHTYESSNAGKSYTSEELLAECFKKLKSFVQDEDVRAVAITVPARFLDAQNEAIRKAGRLAGFEQIELIPEPIAAGIYFGLDSKAINGYFLVFNFQDEFNVSLCKAEDGIISIVDNDGDNWLGDKDIIGAIVDEIIIPYIKENYAIDFILKDPDKKKTLRNAVKFYAEEAKQQLNYKDSYYILSNLCDLPFEDENGDELELDIELTQQDLAWVSRPTYQKAIDITIDLLRKHNKKDVDIEHIIFVGEETHSPILRNLIKEQINERIDTSIDPITVVTKGAALFASTIPVSYEVKETTSNKTKLQLDIKFEATVELYEMVNFKVLKEKTTGTFPEKIYADVVRFDGAWSSGKKLIGERAKIVDVLLIEGCSNSFEINVYDEAGNKLECQPHQFSILQGIGGLDKMQVLPYNIGIGKYFSEFEEDRFACVKGLEKNKSIPVTGVRNGLKTRSAIRPGMIKDIIRIPIFQGDHNSEGTTPSLNNLVYEVIITGETMPALLPEGSDVDITIRVDGSQLMKFTAYFPLLNHTEELEIEIKQTEAPTEELLTKEIAKAKRTAQKVNANDVFEKLEALKEQLENKKGSAPGRMEVLDGLRKELLKLDRAEKIAEWPKVEQELKDAFYELEDLIVKVKANSDDDDLNMDKVEAHIQEYKKAIEQVIKDKNTKEARHLIREIDSFDFNLRNAVTGNAIDVQFLKHIDSEFNSYHWKDRNKARQLCNQGLQMATSGNTGGIRTILVQLIALMPDDEKPKNTLG